MGKFSFCVLLSVVIFGACAVSSEDGQNTGDEFPRDQEAGGAEQAAFAVGGESFWIDRFEVAEVGEGRYAVRQGLMPVTSISFEQARSVCKGRGMRICQLREWKLACIGSNGWQFGYGASSKKGYCNLDGQQLEPTGYRIKCLSESRVHDMVGNAAEWVIDSRVERPVIAGGSYRGASTENCFSAVYAAPGLREKDVGVRCCK